MNVIGTKTLLLKEVQRFMRVPGQTLMPSLVITVLYFIVFGAAVAGRVPRVEGVPLLHFMVPGLVFLGVTHNAFTNSATSLFMARLQGTVVDLLVTPLGPGELMAGFVLSAMARSLLVGGLTWAVAGLFTGFHLEHPGAVVFFLLLSAYVFSVLGLLGALWADTMDQLNAIPAFVLLPLTFVSGVFYSIRELPRPWSTLSLLNPLVYMVEGLRYGILGYSGDRLLLGGGILAGVAVAATAAAYWLLRSGYKLQR
jgi:ABC-2 type transport system permease protein